jgi:phosphoribosylaminoimidazole carboxylase (NCAIR synthetase)
MDMLSQLEVDMLKSTASSDLYQLFRNCSLAVLNSGSLTDNSKELLSRFESFDINVLRRERGVKLELINPPEEAFPLAHAGQQAQAESMLSAIMQELGYVGVMAMECFVTPGGLLINELAPRVHNSGHWSQNGASISQFELHLRAITDLPLPQPVVTSPSVMINLIGTDLNYTWLALPLVHLHWYDKEVRPGRKVGHLNLNDTDTGRLSATLEAMVPLLPPEYASGIAWAQAKLQ